MQDGVYSIIFAGASNFLKDFFPDLFQDVLCDIIAARVQTKTSSIHMRQTWVELSQKVITNVSSLGGVQKKNPVPAVLYTKNAQKLQVTLHIMGGKKTQKQHSQCF